MNNIFIFVKGIRNYSRRSGVLTIFLLSFFLFISPLVQACTVTGTVTNVSCNGGNNGAITVSVSGGTSPYHWLWNNGTTTQNRSSLTAGTYTVTVTDYYNHTGSASFTVTQPSALSVTAAITNVTSYGGTNGAIDVTVSGGSSPYTYLWNGGATTQDRTGLAAGTYTVTVTDNHSCTAVRTYTITQPTCNATINSVIIYNLSNGSTFSTIAENGSYQLGSLPSSWNIEALVSGTIGSVQFTFSGSSTVTNIENSTPYRCPGDATQLNLGVGSYTLVIKIWTASNAGGSVCTQLTRHFSITPNCSLGLTATSTNVSCNGGSNGSIDVSVSGAQGTVTYLWNNGATTQDRSGLAAGTYTVTATDGGCSGCTATLTRTITQPTALSVTAGITNVTINGGSDGAIDVTVTGGTTPYHYLWNNGATTQDRTGLTAGTYTVTVYDYNNCSSQQTYTITQPTCNGQINSVIIYNLTSGTTFSTITDNSSYTLGSLPSSWNVEALVSGSTAESVQFTWSGSYTATNIENTVPFRSPTDDVPLNLGIGSYTLNVKLYSADNAGGSLCAETTLHFSITPSCTITVSITPNGGACATFPAVLTANASNGSTCGTTTSDCNHTLVNSGGFLDLPQASTICGDNSGTKLWTQGGYGTSFITLDFGVVVPAGTVICANMKLEHCVNSSTTYSNAQISSSLSSNSGFSTIVSSLQFSQTTYQEFCYTLTTSAQYIKILDNGNCAFRVDYVKYTTTTNNSNLTYLWSTGATTSTVTINSAGTYTVTATDCQGCSASASYNKPSTLNPTATSTNVPCNGGNTGAIDVSVTGGTSPYTYLWNSGATTQDRTGLAAGTYTVTVTDYNGCTASLTRTITQPSALSVTAVVTNITCYGGNTGAIDVSVSGGTSPYTYLWNNGATTQDRSGLAAGTYTVTVTDYNGCTSQQTYTITQPTCTLSLSATTVNVSCYNGNNGSIDVSVSGAQGNVTYLWNNGATTQDRTGLAAGTYTVTANDGSCCTYTLTRTITQPTQLSVSSVVTNITCYGSSTGAIDVSVSGGTSPYTYLWNNGATTQDRTGLAAGTYTVTVTDNNGCTAQQTNTITQPTCTLSLSATTVNVSCYNGNNGSIDVSVSGAQGNVSYLWNDGATTQDRTGLVAGTYTVTANDGSCCTYTLTRTITQPPCTISLSATTNHVSCYNGNNGSIDVSVSGAQNVVTYLWNDGATTQDRTGLSAGTYTVTATDGSCYACTATLTRTIEQPSTPVGVVVTKTDATGTCSHDGTATATASGGTSPYSYLWSTGANTSTITGLSSGTYTVTVTDSHGCTVSGNVTINQPQCSFFISENHTDVSCNGGNNGSIIIGLHGNQGAVTYIWNDGATTQNRSGLSAGTYTVTATDACGCSDARSITISQPTSSVSVSVSKTDVTITGGGDGTATASAGGGTPNYTYLWSTGATTTTITGLTAGTYTVTATDSHGCMASNQITLNQPPCSIALSETHIDVMCFQGSNGSIDINVSGAQGSVSYLWNDGATTQDRSGLSAGTYTVTATDAGSCSAQKSVTISQPSSAVGVSMSKTDVTITNGNDGTATASASGGTPNYTYLWSTGATATTITGLTAGTYTVTATDLHGCTASNNITLNQPPCSVALSETHIDVMCFQGSNGSIDISVSGAQGSVSYLWNDGATTQDRSGLSAGTYTVTATDAGSCSAQKSVTISQPSSAVGVSMSKTDVTITNGNDGTATASASGGTPGYSYSWSTGATTSTITGLTVGTHTVTVTDSHGCTASNQITLNQPQCSISMDATVVHVTCHGSANGSINVTVSGAQGAVAYLWNDGATTEDRTGLSGGTYTVTATDAGGCSTAISRSVNEPAVLGISSVIGNVTTSGGHDGSINITVTGGTSPYSYLWNDGVTTEDRSGLSAGTYTVTVNDAHNCSAQASFTLTQPCSIHLSLTCKKPKCFGGSNASINITVTGAIGSVTYLWNDGATTEDRTGLSAGIYTVTGTDQGGCVASISKNITNPAQLVVTETHVNVSTYGGHNGSIDISLSGGSGAQRTYLWNDGATTQDRSGLYAGTYTVTAYDANHCSASKTVIITQPAGKDAFAETNSDGAMKIYPNPAENNFNIDFKTNDNSEQEYTVFVENMLGQIIYSAKSVTTSGMVQKSISFDQSVSDGMYSVHIIIGGKEFSRQLIIQHSK